MIPGAFCSTSAFSTWTRSVYEVEVGSEKIPVEVSIDDSRLSVSKDIEAEEDIFDEFYEILTMVLENMTMLFEGMKKGVDSIQDHSW